MLCFVFPGQGSQQPAMGAAFVDDPSWALVDEASDAAGPRRRPPAARRRRRRAGRDPQRAARHVRPLDGRARRPPPATARPRRRRRSQPRRVLRAVRRRCARLRRRRPARGRAGRRHAGLHHAARPAPWPPCSASTTTPSRRPAPAPTATSGSPTQRARPGRHRRRPGRRRGGRRRRPRTPGPSGSWPSTCPGAFHTPFMAAAGERLDAAIAAAIVPRRRRAGRRQRRRRGPHRRRRLARPARAPARHPVRWARSVETLVGLGADTFVEVGPGAVLTGTIKRIAKDAARHSVDDARPRSTPSSPPSGAAT